MSAAESEEERRRVMESGLVASFPGDPELRVMHQLHGAMVVAMRAGTPIILPDGDTVIELSLTVEETTRLRHFFVLSEARRRVLTGEQPNGEDGGDDTND